VTQVSVQSTAGNKVLGLREPKRWRSLFIDLRSSGELQV
jgi:hypothetical protein